MIISKDLQFSYDIKTHFKFPDLQCTVQQPLLILGQSGTGKTTLLYLLGALLRAKQGQILLNNVDINTLSNAQLTKFRGKYIGMVFQQSHFLSAVSVKNNLLMAQHLAGMPADFEKIKQLLDSLQVADKLNSKPNTLSVGQQQRVAIARALVNEPQLILADEPTSSLDDDNAQRVANLLQKAAVDANACLIIVTHDARLKNQFPNQIILQ